ncbi:MAG: lipase family protein [Frankia sp.]
MHPPRVVAPGCRVIALVMSATALAATSSLGGAVDPAAAATPPAAGSVLPDQDPFYQAPANIGSYRAGQIVATRPVAAATSGSTHTWQIAYRSNDSHNHAELAVTTVLVPTAAWTGPGARPVVSEQYPEDATGTQCAPSYALATGAGATPSSMLAKGWAVAIPDYEGPTSVWMAGPQAGHATLDGVRAVKSFHTDGIGALNPWALDGYSGGGEATGWAAQLQPSYAPEVRLVGVAMGGTPADPEAVAKSLDGGFFSGFEFAATESLAREFPESGIAGILNARGRTDLQNAAGKCLAQILTQFPFRKLTADTTVADPFAVPSIAGVMKENTLGAAPPAAPIYDYHADTDEIVPVAQDNALTKAWCGRGATVQTVRDLVGEHGLEALVQSSAVLTFLTNRFADAKATNTC